MQIACMGQSYEWAPALAILDSEIEGDGRILTGSDVIGASSPFDAY
jgi:hypothetical protein